MTLTSAPVPSATNEHHVTWCPEGWEPEATVIRNGLGVFQQHILPAAENEDLDWDQVTGVSLHHRIPTLTCYSVKPHIDPDFAGWTALWILQSEADHVLWAADHVPKGYGDVTRRPLKSEHVALPLTMGSILIFNNLRTHWVPRPMARRRLVCVTHEFSARPTRAAAEAALCQLIQDVQPGFPQDQAAAA